MDTPDSIEIVANDKDSDIYVKPVPVVEPEKVLTLEAQADKDLWAKYQSMKHECHQVEPKERLKVPKARIDEILNLMKTKTYNIYHLYHLRTVIVPVCIE